MRKTIELAVQRWAAWAPNLTSKSHWQEWATGNRSIGGDESPDVRFVPPLMRRRLSSVSRMAFRVAVDCLNSEEHAESYIFCSRYGEFKRAYGILGGLASNEPVSAAAFSTSVHNTAASLFSIYCNDTSPSSSLASVTATLETSFFEAWSQLSLAEVSSVLLVYCDEPLPEIYKDRCEILENSIALAFLLRLPTAEQDETRLSLQWRDKCNVTVKPENGFESTKHILKLMLTGKGPLIVDADRLVWEWRCENASS